MILKEICTSIFNRMHSLKIQLFFSVIALLLLAVTGCKSSSVSNGDQNDSSDNEEEEQYTPVYYTTNEFVMGADLSYVNQILDHGGTYRDSGAVENPYKIFKDHGANVARFRLWHNPEWVRDEVYNDPDVPLYSGLADVEKAIGEAKGQGMEVALDFHYSDIWADPGRQDVPKAWRNITDLEVLKDSVYKYTKQTLAHLGDRGLMPEMVQIGNEINCGMMTTDTNPDFPDLENCEGNWSNQGAVINEGIRAVREIAASTGVDTKIILHVAQPENVKWWFNNMTSFGDVNDFDIIGFSYYSRWSSESLESISDHITDWRQSFSKEVMIMETAYPWTLHDADDYGNIFDEDTLTEGYSASKEGQRAYMIRLIYETMDGGGAGVFYWEPAWITSEMKDLWGTGSAWDNNALFDFEGNVHEGIEFYTYPYHVD